jgi:hypothetical protein
MIPHRGSSSDHFTSPTTMCRRTALPLTIRNPNGSIMYSTHEGEVDIPHLPAAACTVHIVPDLASHLLLSIGQLCNAECKVEFTATNVIVLHNNRQVLHGMRTPATQLWHINLPTKSIDAETNAAIGSATASELVAFAHASLFTPTLSTLATALDKGYIPNFPGGLSSRTLRNHPPQLAAMIKGHLDQACKNQHSTKSTKQHSTKSTLIPPDPAPAPPVDRTLKFSQATRPLALRVGLGPIFVTCPSWNQQDKFIPTKQDDL